MMSAESGPQNEVRYAPLEKERAQDSHVLASSTGHAARADRTSLDQGIGAVAAGAPIWANVPPPPRSETIRREQLEKRYQELERRYQELYAVYERVLREQDEERSRLRAELAMAEEDSSRMREEIRQLQEQRPSTISSELARIDETLAKIRQREGELFRKVEEVHKENDMLASALKAVRQAEARAQIDQARSESRLRAIAEVLLRHSLSLSAARENLQQISGSLRSMLPPLQGELKRSPSTIGKGLLRDLEAELAHIENLDQRMAEMTESIAKL
jgi:chromosome segregation ATPase